MKHFRTTAIGLFLLAAMTLDAAAATVCTPIPPKEWTGHVQVARQGGSAALTYFENNGCNWNGLDQLNGTDGLVFDVEGQSGTGNASAIFGPNGTLGIAVQGYFLDASCKKINASDFHISGSVTSAPTADLITIPVGSKWMEINGATGGFSNDINITVHSDGMDCPTPTPTKKKKKKH